MSLNRESLPHEFCQVLLSKVKDASLDIDWIVKNPKEQNIPCDSWVSALESRYL